MNKNTVIKYDERINLLFEFEAKDRKEACVFCFDGLSMTETACHPEFIEGFNYLQYNHINSLNNFVLLLNLLINIECKEKILHKN